MTPTPATPGEQFATLKLSTITPSLSNPRKHFDATALTELASSITALGVHQPVLVRPLPGSRVADTDRGVQYELVCGERRYRASLQAGVPTIPAMVRALTDDQVREIQIVENLQRQDLTELEEAEGYEQLMEHSGYNADQVGDKIGKSRSYVYARLKLLDLCSDARTSLRKGDIEFSNALLVARIPDHKLQVKALKEIREGDRHWSGTVEPMSHRRAAEYIQSNYMLKLSTAKFDTACVTLVPAAGACQACPKRTGHSPELFPEVKSADVCIDPPCFHKKEDAHAKQLVQAAQDKGQTVIHGKEAQELVSGPSYASKFKGYRRLDSAEDSPTDQPLRKIIGKQMQIEGVKPTMIESNKGELIACLPNEVALRLLKAVEGQAAAAKTVAKEVRELVDSKKAKADAKAKAAYEQEWRDQLVARVWQGIMRVEDPIEWFGTNLHRYLAVKTANNLSNEQAAKVVSLFGWGSVGAHSALLDHIKTHEDPERIHLLMILVRDSSANDVSYTNQRIANEGMHLVAQSILGNALEATLKDIQVESFAKHFPRAKEKKPDLPQSPLAQPENARGKGPEPKAKPNAKTAPLRKPKLSEQEAISGIAAAMQGVDRAAAAPDGAVALPEAQQAQLGVGFVIGQRVRVTTDNDKLGMYTRKWSGKEGTVTKTNADNDSDMYDVTFKGRSGGIAMFRTDQIEVVAA